MRLYRNKLKNLLFSLPASSSLLVLFSPRLQYGPRKEPTNLKMLTSSRANSSTCFGIVTLLWFACLLFGACSPRFHDSYVREYQYLGRIRECSALLPQFQGTEEYFLVVHVDARHLDYSSPEAFFASMRWGLFLPQEPTIGHAWIYLVGKVHGKIWQFEGGHTGEFGLTAPRYFDEVVRLSLEESDPNPAQYLFYSLSDGQLQKGSGGHSPTFSAAFPLTEEQFIRVYRLLQAYDFKRWSLQDHQCVNFVLACLKSIDISIACTQTFKIPQDFEWQGKKIHLWSDKKYENLILTTPDALEKALFEKVLEKKALIATKCPLKKGASHKCCGKIEESS